MRYLLPGPNRQPSIRAIHSVLLPVLSGSRAGNARSMFRSGVAQRQQLFNMLLDGVILHEPLPLRALPRRGMVMNVALAIHQSKLRDNHSLRHVESHERHHLVSGYVSDWKADVEPLG